MAALRLLKTFIRRSDFTGGIADLDAFLSLFVGLHISTADRRIAPLNGLRFRSVIRFVQAALLHFAIHGISRTAVGTHPLYLLFRHAFTVQLVLKLLVAAAEMQQALESDEAALLSTVQASLWLASLFVGPLWRQCVAAAFSMPWWRLIALVLASIGLPIAAPVAIGLTDVLDRSLLFVSISAVAWAVLRPRAIVSIVLRLPDLLRWTPHVTREKFVENQGRVDRLEPYRYRSLRRREIRLVRLERRSWQASPRCTLVHCSLDDPPPYEAVSYMWGDAKDLTVIQVGGRSLEVTHSVFFLLWYRQSYFSSCLLWIDAVCIDQSDNDEKSRQIPLMRDIYGSAFRVWVSLKQPATMENHLRGSFRLLAYQILFEGVSASTRAALRRTKGEQDAFSRGVLTEAEVASNMRRLEFVGGTMHSRDKKASEQVLSMLAERWFQRVWIIQEISLARGALVSYEGLVLDWRTVSMAVKVVGPREYFPKFDPILQDPNSLGVAMTKAVRSRRAGLAREAASLGAIRETTQEGQSLTLSQLLLLTRRFQSTNPRDRVFSLLGLASDADKLPFEPRYDDTPEEVFVNTTRYLVCSDMWLPFLCWCGNGYEYEPPSALRGALPSWAIDLTVTPRGYSVLLANYERDRAWTRPASSSNDPGATPVSFAEDGKTMQLSGRIIDEITTTGPCFSLSDLAGAGLGVSDIPFPDWQLANCRRAIEFMAPVWETDSSDGSEDDQDDNHSTQSCLLLSHHILPTLQRPEHSDRQAMIALATALKRRVDAREDGDISMEPELQERCWRPLEYRRLCMTKAGYLFLGPQSVQDGDGLFYIRTTKHVGPFSEDTALVLRRVDEGYALVGSGERLIHHPSTGAMELGEPRVYLVR